MSAPDQPRPPRTMLDTPAFIDAKEEIKYHISHLEHLRAEEIKHRANLERKLTDVAVVIEDYNKLIASYRALLGIYSPSKVMADLLDQADA